MREIKIRIGKIAHQGIEKDVFVRGDDIFRHQYVLGATGTGKSTLINHEVLQAFRQGLCTWVIDPHGDLALDIVESVYPEELENVYLLDPLKVRFSLNPFELPKYEGKAQREIMVERMIGEIVSFMKKLYGFQYWGPSLNRIFQNALRRLYMDDDSPTFKEMLNLVREELEGYEDFYDELDKLPRGRTDAVINKLEPFVKNDLLRDIFCQKVSSVDIEKFLGPNKLVVWKLSKGELSEMNTGLIGSALITKLWLTIVSRERGLRAPVFLAIDEFQNFAHLQTLSDLVTEGRKYRIGLLLAHQHTKQVPEKLLGDVLGNTATKIVFRVNEGDASIVARSFEYGEKSKIMDALTGLPDGKAVVKLRSGFGERSLPPFEISTLRPVGKKHYFTGKLLERMRMLYSAPKLPEKPSIKSDVDPEIIDLLKTVHSIREQGEETTRTNISERVSVPGSKLSEQLDIAESKGLVKRIVRKEGRGRPKVLTELTEKGEKAIGVGVTSGSSAKAGGELHRALLFRAKEWLESQGYYVVIPEQGGREEQPDMLAYPRLDDGWGREIAVEVESSANHPEQILKNYEKNVKKGRFVVFVVGDEEVEEKVMESLKGTAKNDHRVYNLSEKYFTRARQPQKR